MTDPLHPEFQRSPRSRRLDPALIFFAVLTLLLVLPAAHASFNDPTASASEAGSAELARMLEERYGATPVGDPAEVLSPEHVADPEFFATYIVAGTRLRCQARAVAERDDVVLLCEPAMPQR